MADALSELYFICCLLKRYEDDGRLAAERPVFDYAVQKAFHGFYAAMREAIDNFPILGVRPLLKFCVFPLGNHFRKPKDSAGQDGGARRAGARRGPRPAHALHFRLPRRARSNRAA